ncbi:hypothetical protein CMI37_08605 [Candidatus Pacearchaeota archaeon]|nr:hypothetical protein [Candidatus Pacearchaeota archaeon]|tara:strand:+ start:645 stop:941 length:297 start_codon:yes stop_codon:yes gene_type:complete
MSALYFVQSNKTGMIKIGRSKDPERRLKQLQTANSHCLRLIVVFDNLGWMESVLHKDLKRWRIRQNGEWFHYDCVGSIPDALYEQIEFGAFDDWWKEV